MHLHWTPENREAYERVRKLMGEEVEQAHIHNMLNLIGDGAMEPELALAFTVRHLAVSNAGLMKDITALAMARPFEGIKGVVIPRGGRSAKVFFKDADDGTAEQTEDHVARWTEAAVDTLKRCNLLLKTLRGNGDLTGNRQELDCLIGNTAMLRDNEIPAGYGDDNDA